MAWEPVKSALDFQKWKSKRHPTVCSATEETHGRHKLVLGFFGGEAGAPASTLLQLTWHLARGWPPRPASSLVRLAASSMWLVLPAERMADGQEGERRLFRLFPAHQTPLQSHSNSRSKYSVLGRAVSQRNNAVVQLCLDANSSSCNLSPAGHAQASDGVSLRAHLPS